jgi:type II secretory pathway component PulL
MKYSEMKYPTRQDMRNEIGRLQSMLKHNHINMETGAVMYSVHNVLPSDGVVVKTLDIYNREQRAYRRGFQWFTEDGHDMGIVECWEPINL